MTDQISALAALMHDARPVRLQALEKFYNTWQHDALVLDKWFAVQTIARRDTIFFEVQQLILHPDFSFRNPNKVRALIGTFTRRNVSAFHRLDGLAYEWLTEIILKLDDINPMIAARLMEPLSRYRRFDAIRAALMEKSLRIIMNHPSLSKDVYEVVSKMLAK